MGARRFAGTSSSSAGPEGSRFPEASGPGPRLWALWIVLLAALVAVTVSSASFAAGSNGSSPQDLATPSGFPGSSGPPQEAIEAAQLAEARRRERRESPAGKDERSRSRRQFSGMSGAEARQLAEQQHPAVFRSKVWSPFRDAERRGDFLDRFSARVRLTDGRDAVAVSSLPLQSENEAGQAEAVDLRLDTRADGILPRNPLIKTRFPARSNGSIEIGDIGVSLGGDAPAQLQDDRVFYASAGGKDIDLIAQPLPSGVETFAQIRSVDAPEEMRMSFNLPTGTSMRRGTGDQDGLEIVKDSKVVGHVTRPTAVDAQQKPVPVTYRLEGDDLVMTVKHQSGDYAMPIMVDPQVWYAWNEQFPRDNSDGWGAYQSNSASRWCGFYGDWYDGRGLYTFSRVDAGLACWPTTYSNNEVFEWNYYGEYARSSTAAVVSWEEGYNFDPGYGGVCHYSGTYSVGMQQWETYSGNECGYTSSVRRHYGSGSAPNYAVFGTVIAGSGRREVFTNHLWGATVFLVDRENPTVEEGTRTIPSTWTRNTTFDVTGRDPGLGVDRTEIRATPQGASAADYSTGIDRGCSADPSNHCGAVESFAHTTNAIPEGIRDVSGRSRDVDARYSPYGALGTLWLDRTGPVVTPGGELWQHRREGGSSDKTLNGEQYSLRISATDGTPGATSATAKRSGVASTRVDIETTPGQWTTLKTFSNPTTGDNAALPPQTFDFRPDAYAESVRSMRIVTKDRAGNTTITPFTVDVQRTPRAGTMPYSSMLNEDLTDRTRMSVNAANGNLMVRTTEFKLAGVGLDLILGRVYNSWDHDTPGEFGPGWKLSLGQSTRLDQRPDGDMDFRGPDGYRVRFEKNSDGSYQRPGGLHAKLSKPSSSTYQIDWFRKDVKWTFSSGGTLQSIKDRDNNQMNLDYYTNGRLQRIRNGYGANGSIRRERILDITRYNADGYIEEIYDRQADRVARFTYLNGRLASASDPLFAVTRFRYNAQGRLDQITDARGNPNNITYEPNTTVPSFPRVLSFQRPADAAGARPTTSFVWDESANSQSERRERVRGPRHTSSIPVETVYTTDQLDRVEDVTDPAGGDAGRGYDASGNVASSASGTDSTFQYDASGENLSEISQGAVSTRLGYGDSAVPNSPTSAQDGGGRWRRNMTYNTSTGGKDLVKNENATPGASDSELASVQMPRTTNGVGTIDKITDGLGHTTDYQYTSEHELSLVVPQGRSAGDANGLQRFTYDAASRIETATDGKNRTVTYGYDKQDRLTSVAYPSGAEVSYDYDVNGNRTAMTDQRGTTNYGIDALNRQLDETRGGQTLHSYSWDLAGNMATHSQPGQSETYAYDRRDLPASVTDAAGKRTVFDYGLDHRKLTATRIEPVTGGQRILIDRDYDSSGRVKSVRAVTNDGDELERFDYGYSDNDATSDADKSAQKEYVRDRNKNQCTDWDYDSLQRLVEVRTTNSANDCDFDNDGSASVVDRIRYTYDRASNLAKRVRTGGANTTTTFRVNDRNELCWIADQDTTATCGSPPAGADDVVIDDAGHITTIRNRASFTYNERNQTASITPSGGSAASQSYAGVGQSERTTSGSNSFEHGLVGLSRATNTAATGTQPLANGTTRYVRAPDGTLVSQRKPDGTLEYFLTDAHPGSVVALARADRVGTTNPVVTGRYRYDPYGNVTAKTGSSDTAWRFAGAWFDRFASTDATSQQGLYKMGERYYDPRMGRWTQKDPLDQSADLREGNGYTYAASDPVNGADPTGLATCGSALSGFYVCPQGEQSPPYGTGGYTALEVAQFGVSFSEGCLSGGRLGAAAGLGVPLVGSAVGGVGGCLGGGGAAVYFNEDIVGRYGY